MNFFSKFIAEHKLGIHHGEFGGKRKDLFIGRSSQTQLQPIGLDCHS